MAGNSDLKHITGCEKKTPSGTIFSPGNVAMLLLMGRPPRRLIRGISPALWGNCIGHALFKLLLIAPPRRDGGARLESSERGSVRVRVAGRGGRGRGGSKMGNLAHAEHYLFPQFSRNPFLSPLHFPCERKQLPLLPLRLLLEHRRPRCRLCFCSSVTVFTLCDTR